MSSLFSPGSSGSATSRNRFVCAATHGGMADITDGAVALRHPGIAGAFGMTAGHDPHQEREGTESDMKKTLRLTDRFPVARTVLFMDWLDSEKHGAFTGSTARIDPVEGGDFSAWDGYIGGKTVTIIPHERIIQTWRTADFPEGSPDSVIELTFEESAGFTVLTIVHRNIPEGQEDDYREGWSDFYFTPMHEYYG